MLGMTDQMFQLLCMQYKTQWTPSATLTSSFLLVSNTSQICGQHSQNIHFQDPHSATPLFPWFLDLCISSEPNFGSPILVTICNCKLLKDSDWKSGLVSVFDLQGIRPRLRLVHQSPNTSKNWTGLLRTGFFLNWSGLVASPNQS